MKAPILFFLLILSLSSFSQTIKNYQAVFGTYSHHKKEKPNIVLRKFSKDQKNYFLCVNPQTLKTSIVKDSAGTFQKFSIDQLKEKYKNTPYIKALETAASKDSELQDAGISHTIPSERGINLTIDLCPSSKPLDKEIFTSIITEFNKIEKPAPIALSVSGLWMNDHKQDLEWIKKQIKDSNIVVDWINHSYHHRYNKQLPLKDNFLLEKGTDINYEILENEITMIENDLTPSILFRFPGLISDKSVFDKVVSYGLISIGSDAWLAKNQTPKSGSIVLIHGNGNEPLGVRDFIKLITTEKSNIKNKNWLLYDLTDSLAEEEK